MNTGQLIQKIIDLQSDLQVIVTIAERNDPKLLAEALKEMMPVLERNYQDLTPYMTEGQQFRSQGLSTLGALALLYFENGEDRLTEMVTKFVPRMLEDFRDLEGTARWVGDIAHHMGCPVSELVRFNSWPWPPETKTAAQ
jgi:hypothetical protein